MTQLCALLHMSGAKIGESGRRALGEKITSSATPAYRLAILFPHKSEAAGIPTSFEACSKELVDQLTVSRPVQCVATMVRGGWWGNADAWAKW